MKAYTTVTAIEVLKEAGIVKPEEKIGKMRVRIAGVAGIVKPDHRIKIQPGTKEIEVIVGTESYKVAFEEGEAEQAVSDEAKVALEAKDKKAEESVEEPVE